MTGNLVSSNIIEVKKLDEFMSHLLEENIQMLVCALNKILEEIQERNIDIMGPL